MSPIVLAIAIILSVALGVVLALYLHPSRRILSEREARLEELNGEVVGLRTEVAKSGVEKARLQERIATLEPLSERIEKQQNEITALSTENARLSPSLNFCSPDIRKDWAVIFFR